MDDSGAGVGLDDARGVFDKFSGLAKDGLANASQGMRDLLGGKEIGHPDAPETGRSQPMKLSQAMNVAATKGLDPLTYQGFEKTTHDIARDDFELQRTGRDRGKSHGGRDFE